MAFSTLLLHKRRRPSRLSRRRWSKRIGYTVMCLLFAVSLLTLLSFLSYQDEYVIDEITVDGNALVPSNALIDRAAQGLEGTFLGLFSKRNRFLVRKEALARDIEAVFPAVESLSVKLGSPHELLLLVRERIPFAVWCGKNVPDTNVSSRCYFSDKEGFLFTEAPDFSSGIYPRFASSIASSTISGNYILPKESFTEFQFFLQSLKTLGLSVQEISIEERSGNRKEYALVLLGGASLLISEDQSFERTLENISAFLNDPVIGARKEGFFDTIDYIDFRFGNKIYYK